MKADPYIETITESVKYEEKVLINADESDPFGF